MSRLAISVKDAWLLGWVCMRMACKTEKVPLSADAFLEFSSFRQYVILAAMITYLVSLVIYVVLVAAITVWVFHAMSSALVRMFTPY